MSEKKLLPKVNIDVTRLPSQGKSYPKDFVASYRSYSFGEIKHASTSKLNEKQSLELVLSGVQTNMNKNLFTLIDVLFIGILRKLASLGTAQAQVPFENPVTKKVEYHVFGLDDIEFQDMDAPTIPAKVTLSNDEEYTFEPLRVKSYLKLIRLGKQKDSVALFAAMCTSHSFDEAYKFFDGTQVREDGEILEEIDNVLAHGIKPLKATYKFERDSEIINRTIKIRLEGRQALLLPFRKERKSVRDRIRFGDASRDKSE